MQRWSFSFFKQQPNALNHTENCMHKLHKIFHRTLADGHALVRTPTQKKIHQTNEMREFFFQMRTKNEKRYETFKMQIHAADEVYNVYMVYIHVLLKLTLTTKWNCFVGHCIYANFNGCTV